MNIAAPSRIRLLVLVVVFLVAVGGFAVTILPRLEKSPDTSVAVPPPSQQHTATSAHVQSSTPKPSRSAKPATTTPLASAPPSHKTAKPSIPAVHKSAIKIGAWVPKRLARELEKHSVVVVAFGAGGAVDVDARGEAKVGAALADSGFLAIDAAKERQVKPFRPLLEGNFDVPTVLVVRRPGSVFVRFDGFADRQLVEQAAANAARR